jgi:hypothetical protein
MPSSTLPPCTENYDVRVRMDGKIDQVVLTDILSKHP